MKKLFKNKIFKGVVGTLLCVCILLFAAVIGINAYMISFSKKNFVTVDELKADSYDCILVLGAGLWSGKPSPMLKERLDFSLEAYNKECSDRFLVSGDHGTKNYDEVNAMKDYLVETVFRLIACILTMQVFQPMSQCIGQEMFSRSKRCLL